MSAFMTLRTWRTPGSPRAATAHAQARPISTALAPERHHLDHVKAGPHAAVDEHLGAVADRLGDGRQRTGRRRHRVELTTAVVGDDHAVDADLDGAAGVLGVKHALDDEPAVPVLADPGDVVPGDARIELRVDPAAKRVRAAGARHGLLEVPERERLVP